MSLLAKPFSLPGRFGRVLLAFVLVVGLFPPVTLSLAYAADAGQNDKEIEALLAAGEYREGEAIAIVRADLACDELTLLSDILPWAKPSSEALLASGETLMETSVAVAQEGLGVDLPDAQNAVACTAADSGENMVLESADVAQDEAVEVVFVSRNGMSTRDLLSILMDNPRVISAEPNYVYQLEDEAGQSDLSGEVAIAGAGEAAKSSANTDASANAALLESDGAPERSAADITQTEQDGGLVKDSVTGSYDLSALQWAYGDTAAYNRPNKADSDSSAMGIANWNSPAGEGNAEGTVVAVIDTGVDFDNPDLKNVVISEQNAQISRLCGGGDWGYNPVDDGDATDCGDVQGHGSHCAGIIAAEWNGFGTSGAADGVELLSVRVFGKGANDEQMRDIVEGYEYLCRCRQAGMNIVAASCSWGYALCSKTVLGLAIAKLGRSGAISVFAAGNDDYDNDIHASTPTALAENPYVVTVNAMANGNEKTLFSSYGQMSTNVYGAGAEIVSTYGVAKTGYLFAPADTQPLYRNYFENEDLSAHLWISEAETSEDGSLIYPSTINDVGEFASDAASWSSAASVDAKDGSGSLAIAKEGQYWLVLPVENEDAAKQVTYGSFQSFGESGAQGSPLAAVYPVVQVAPGSVETGWYIGYSGRGTWARDAVELLGGKPEGATLYTLSGEGETAYILFLLRAQNVSIDNPYYIDVLSLHTADALEGDAGKWALLNGTSMATPSVTGCAAIVASSLNDSALSDAEKARYVANYLKGHVRTLPDLQDTCTQGGVVDLSVADSDATPVINAAKQDVDGGVSSSSDGASRTVTLTGAYFGAQQNTGTVKVGGAFAKVTQWTDSCIIAEVAEGVGSGEQLIEVSAHNGKTGRFKMRYLCNAEGSAQLFPETLSTPNQSAQVQQTVKGLFTGEYGENTGLISNQLIAFEGKLYLAARDAQTERYSKLYCYDPQKDEWTIAADFAGNQEEAWTYCSIAAAAGRIWCYGTKTTYASYGAEAGCVPVMFAYNPQDASVEDIDVSALGLGSEATFVGATLVAFGDDLMLAGGMDGSLQVLSQDNLAYVQIADGALTYEPVCTLAEIDRGNGEVASGVVGAQTVVRGNSIYLGAYSSGLLRDGEYWGACLNPSLIVATRNADGSWTSADMSSTLPGILWTSDFATATGYLPLFSLSATKDALVISGANVRALSTGETAVLAADGASIDSAAVRSAFDTYLLPDDAKAFTAYPYAADLGTLFYPTSAVADGYLYTLGATKYDEGDGDTYIFRRVRVEDAQKQDDKKSDAVVPKTGDGTARVCIAVGLVGLLAAACAIRTSRRKA